MTNEEIEKHIDAALGSMGHIWDQGGDAIPCALIIERDRFSVAPGLESDEAGKDAFAQYIKQLCQKNPAITTIVFHSEAWMRFVDIPGIDYEKVQLPEYIEELRRKIAPTEVWMWSVETRDGFRHSRTYKIKRRESGAKYIDRADFEIGNPEGQEGRMVNWFRPVQ